MSNQLNTLFVTDIVCVQTTIFEKPLITHMNKRPWYGISFTINGKIIYHHNGRDYLSDSGHAILFPMHASYTLECVVPGRFTLINFLCTEDFQSEEFLSIPISNNDYFLKNHVIMEKLDIFNHPFHRPRLLSVFYDTIANLAESIQPEKRIPLLRPAIQYMTEHLEDVTLCNTQIAGFLDISEVYFRKLFKEGYGVGPMQYLQQLRMTRAKDLLLSSASSISQIAETCGYSSIYHFCRIFKIKTGYTPTEYRNYYRSLGL